MFGSRRVAAWSILAMLTVAACEKKKSAVTTQQNAGLPPLEAAETGRPVHAPSMEGLPPNHPPTTGELPPNHPPVNQANEMATPGNVPFDPKSVVSGVLRLDDRYKSKVAEGDTIFLAVRTADPSGAPG